MKTYIENVNTS